MSKEQKKTDWKKLDVGALWKRVTPSGRIVLNGTLTFKGENVRVVAFVNESKEKESHPDIKIYIDPDPVKDKPIFSDVVVKKSEKNNTDYDSNSVNNDEEIQSSYNEQHDDVVDL